MPGIFHTVRRAGNTLRRKWECFANGLRFGLIYSRTRWFKMPGSVRAAGKTVSLQYPPETGVRSDFIGCVISNEYGLHRKLPEVRTIIDIGANVGFFSLAARGHYPHATIHAYEPNPRVLPFLSSNLSKLDIGVYPEAVGASNGFVSMLDAGPSNQAQTCSSDHGEIAVIAFDRAIQRIGGQVDLLKLDCEGAEWDLLQLPECWKHIRNLRMEYHLFHGETFAQVEEALRRLGFAIILAKHDLGFGMVWATQSRQPR